MPWPSDFIIDGKLYKSLDSSIYAYAYGHGSAGTTTLLLLILMLLSAKVY